MNTRLQVQLLSTQYQHNCGDIIDDDYISITLYTTIAFISRIVSDINDENDFE